MSRVDDLLAAARARLHRLQADEVPAALERGAILVDIRPPPSAPPKASSLARC